MLRFAADENFNNAVVRGVRRRDPTIDIVRIQDAGLRGADDPTILAWAASASRALLTHDVTTMTQQANQRVVEDLPMPGLFEVHRGVPIRVAIDEICLLAASLPCALPT